MRRLLRDRVARADDGMSLVEVVVAMAILLFALTAMLSLVIASTGLSASARAEGLAAKTASRFIEKVRAEPYANLNQTKLNQMAAAEAGTVGGMTVVITPSITPYREASQPASSNAAYQSVKVVVDVSGPGFKSYRFSTGTYVREWKWTAGGGGGGGGGSGRIPPTVAFDSSTPPAGATTRPIWDTSGGVHVGATATSNMTDVSLTSVYVKWGTSYLASDTLSGQSGSCSSSWNTGALNAEGRKLTVFAEVWDALNQSDSVSRDFIIDNVKPPAPYPVTLGSTTTNSAATWTWPTAMDGETAVPEYGLTLYRLGTSGWPGTATTLTSVVTTSVSVPTTAFSRYQLAVVSRGPRAAAGLTPDWVSAPTDGPRLLTRPSFSAMTVSVRQQNNAKPFYFTASSLVLTPPTFALESGTPTPYTWEYKIGTGAWVRFASAASPNTNPSAVTSVAFPERTGPASGAQPSLSLRCTAKITVDGTANVLVKSPIMTVSNPSGGQTYTLASFTPDWTAW